MRGFAPVVLLLLCLPAGCTMSFREVGVPLPDAAGFEIGRTTKVEVLQALKNYEGAQEALPLARQTLERAEKSLELFRPLYREGRQSIMEVLRAEEGLARAAANYWQTLYQLHAGYARLALAAGFLDEKTIREIAGNLEAGQ